jgi:hypothetical protein
VESFEIIEAYPEDKYPPSYLGLAKGGMSAFHLALRQAAMISWVFMYRLMANSVQGL